MGIRRTLAGAVLGLAGSVLLAAPATAAIPDPYGPSPTPGALGTSTTTVGPGGTVVVNGSGFAPNSTVSISTTVVNSGFTGVREEAATAPLGALLGRTGAAAPVTRFALACVNSCSVTANAAGSFSVAVTLTQPGTNVITASGVDVAGNPRVLTVTVLVAAGGGVGGDGDGSGSGGSGSGDGSGDGATGVGGLPDTGASLKMPVVLGSILVLVGGGAAVLGRRRRRADVAS